MTLAPSKSRIISAIRAAFIADAGSMGTHWIYDPKEMAKAVPSVDAPEFKNPPTPSYYSSEEFAGHYGPGMLSPYGEQLLFVTEYTAYNLDIKAPSLAKAMLQWAESFGGRPDHATSEFVKNMKDATNASSPGADDSQAHCYMKVVPVTCLYVGKPERASKVEEAIRVHQNNDIAVRFGLTMSDILEGVLLGLSIGDAVHNAVEAAKDNVDIDMAVTAASDATELSFEDLLLKISREIMADKPDSPFYDLAGRSCALPGAFIAPMYFFLKAAAEPSVSDEIIISSLRTNILGAGDTCSRAVIIGSILAAAANSVPWEDKVDVDTMKKVDKLALLIANHATA